MPDVSLPHGRKPTVSPRVFRRRLAKTLAAFPFEDDAWTVSTRFGPIKIYDLPPSAQAGGFWIPLQFHGTDEEFRLFWKTVGDGHGCGETSRKWNIVARDAEQALAGLALRLELVGVKI